jgi:hypothetical protein
LHGIATFLLIVFFNQSKLNQFAWMQQGQTEVLGDLEAFCQSEAPCSARGM